ncbi:MAG: hypothetical protein FD146_1905 [Anaerolineaceae bacterium]|nr:MAG: hypothetical protein FD146_1905 [Anaerolineaceae bacterium]
MNRKLLAALLALALVTLACGSGTPGPIPTLESSPYDLGRTLYGFFPSPPEVSLQSVMDTYAAIGQHGDVVLLQQAIPWEDFVAGADGESAAVTDIHNQYILAHQNGLEVVFVVDPLNGLNRREFQGLPAGWEASFANPDVRAAFTNFTLRIVREFHPKYLGLASEINTYHDTHPDDFPNFLSLYNETYALVKAEAPETQIFVTFQWEELNNLMPSVAQGDPYDINWDQIEQFEPNLDLWVISSYPFVIFQSGADIPADYYSPLLARTAKPLAVAEGGYTSEPVGPFPGDPQSQVDYLNAIHAQIGGRLAFWIYLLINDFNLDSYASFMQQNGQNGSDINTLGMFASVGLTEADRTPKPALAVWDSFRK